jgi:hypothetical protein
VGVQEGLGQADAAPSDDGLPAQAGEGLSQERFDRDPAGVLREPGRAPAAPPPDLNSAG